MIPFKDAYQTVIDAAVHLGTEYVPLSMACGRVPDRDILSDIDMPSFNKSAMDGYACKIVDLEKPLKVVETIPAGYIPKKAIGDGECAKIMTGAVVPQGADCVVMIEHTRTDEGMVNVLHKTSATNICFKGEDIKRGDKVLQRGTLITPSEIAVLASVGCDPVSVSHKPLVGVIATGSELVEPSQKQEGAQIRNSNAVQLCSQIAQTGGTAIYLGIVKDSPQALDDSIKNGLSQVDVLLLSGGVSAGDFDYVPEILKANGVEAIFQKIAIKPGKPVLFGRKSDKFVFGLPGNPVSTFIVFEVLVKPFLYKLMGMNHDPLRVRASLKQTITRKKAERLEFIPAFINSEGEVSLVSYHGSGHIHAFAGANAVISIPVGKKEIKEGENITVTLIK